MLLTACGGNIDTDEGSAGEGPQTIEVTGEVSCSDCLVDFNDLALLGDPSDLASPLPNAAGYGCMVGRLGDDRFALSGIIGGGQMLVYDGTAPSTRVIGAPGQGPGEMGRLNRLIVADDSLYVIDETNTRLQVMSKEGEYVRSFPMPSRLRSVARLDNGDFVFNRKPTHDDDAVFYRVSSEGQELARLGRPLRSGGDLDIDSWIVAPRRGGGFWAVHTLAYEIHAWSESNELEFVLRRDVSWFPRDQVISESMYVAAPPPALIDHIHEDQTGYLWIYLRVPEPEWTPFPLGRQPTPAWFRHHFDNHVEVIDPTEGGVVGRGSFDGMLGAVCGEALVYTVEETSAGDTRVRVLVPTLERQEA